MKLAGSEVRSYSRTVAGTPDPNQQINVMVHVTTKTPEDEERLRKFCVDNDLTWSITGSCWKLHGTLARLEAAFGVSTYHAITAGVTHRARSGSINIPDELGHIINAVLGLDNPPIAHYMYRVRNLAASPAGTFTPRQVAEAYEFPLTIHNGVGGRIAIIELGGKYNAPDLVELCKSMNVAWPHVNVIDVDKDKPVSDGPSGADGEVMLDVEVAGSIANHAIIDMYFAPNTDAGFLDGINQAIHSTNRPDAISVSWGSREDSWTAQAMNAMSAVIQEAGPLGVTVCVASGDGGSDDGQGDGVNLPDFPASSPYSLGCGGTKLVAIVTAIKSEVVWEDVPGNPDRGASGGGISKQFPLPSYQYALEKSGRCVPDIAGNADPNSGYNVIVDGQSFPIGGTSAVAPLMAAMICLMNEALRKKVGFINPLLYAAPQATFNQITSGSNGAYSANPNGGYCCGTGLGSINFPRLHAALAAGK